MKSLFILPKVQNKFDEEGYVVLNLFSPNQIDNLIDITSIVDIQSVSDFFYSLIELPSSQNKQIHESISSVILPALDNIFINYRNIAASFLVKPGNTMSELMLHQDWCYTDETEYNTITCWIPLCDVNEDNGAVFLIPGSHKFINIRSASYPTERILSSEIGNRNCLPINLNVGQMLCFNPAIWHGSYPNKKNINRSVVTTIIMSNEAPFLYFQKQNDQNCDVYELNDDCFENYLNKMAYGTLPDGLIKVRNINYKHEPIKAEEVILKIIGNNNRL